VASFSRILNGGQIIFDLLERTEESFDPEVTH
jgi:hypothetical protein